MAASPEVVDQVGEQGDAAGRGEDRHLCGGGEPKHDKGEKDSTHPARERLIEGSTKPWVWP